MKLNKIMLSGIIGTASLSCVAPIVSCACTNAPVVNLYASEHIKNVKLSATPEAGKELYISFTLERGWRDIDLEKTYIKVGNRTLIYGRDYWVHAQEGYIRILPDLIQNAKLDIHLEAKATQIALGIDWRDKNNKYIIDGNFFAPQGTKLSTETIKVSVINGDGSKEEIPYAPADAKIPHSYSVHTKPSILHEYDEINFYDGESTPYSGSERKRIYFRYLDDDVEEWTELRFASTGSSTVSSLTINIDSAQQEERLVGEPIELQVQTDANASTACTWEIVSDTTLTHNAILTNLGNVSNWNTNLITLSEGVVYVRARSIWNREIVSNTLEVKVPVIPQP